MREYKQTEKGKKKINREKQSENASEYSYTDAKNILVRRPFPHKKKIKIKIKIKIRGEKTKER